MGLQLGNAFSRKFSAPFNDQTMRRLQTRFRGARMVRITDHLYLYAKFGGDRTLRASAV